MTMTATSESKQSMPRRSFGTRMESKKLPSSVSIVGLGCSSFSTFFWTDQELQEDASTVSSSDTASVGTSVSLQKNHPRVQEWIQTIVYAVNDAGITLLDTAPWYGHGSSEIVVGWALEELFCQKDDDNNTAGTAAATNCTITREDLIINTKIGRYEADPARQFDFSAAATLASCLRSLDRLQCGYIDVLQLHDPEFAPSLDQLLQETIPAMMECRNKGYCRALGLTGYSLQVQYQIFQRSLELYPDTTVWDQSLTYGHFNLHDRSLLTAPVSAEYTSYQEFCEKSKLLLLAAAPLSMGLLTGTNAPPTWHPADQQLQQACRDATDICTAHGVQISTLALCVALSDPCIPCTILGMKNVGEVQAAAAVAQRMHSMDEASSLTPDEIFKQILTSSEQAAWEILRDPVHGPFAAVWSNGSFQWDGLKGVREFWQQVDDSTHVVEWQKSDYSS
jgi:L-galactose dehydrogenase